MNRITKIEYLREGGTLTAYVHVDAHTVAYAMMGGEKIEAVSNLREPYDFKLHMFPLPEETLKREGGFTVHLHGLREEIEDDYPAVFDPSAVVPLETAMTRADRHLECKGVTDSGSADGIEWMIEEFRTPEGAPVIVYTVEADPEKCDIIAGTPGCETVFTPKHIQTVMEECEETEKRGRTVLAASNADFFDMFGNCAPSGLCVHEGVCVANPEAPTPFFAVTREGKPVIGRLSEYPLETLCEAVSGGQIILCDGEMLETAPLESFGDVAHPRTAFGITAEGKVLVTIVDGRRPAWSNGAALCELAGIMKKHGAVIAMNADGGGSSTVIVKKDEGLTMLNHPADLFRPMEDLIRPLYDSLIIVKK